MEVALLDKADIIGRGKSGDAQPETPRDRVLTMPNEYGKRPSITISPLREVRDGRYDDTPIIRSNMDYLATTRDIEVTAPIITQLQGYLDVWKDNTDVQSIRLVIMKRGEQPEAFAMPDGTIFINQALINLLDTVDELGAVAKHEFDHIKNGTFEASTYKDGTTAFGACWVHETASDLGTPDGLAEVGLRSDGLATAIMKVSSNSRGILHQSGEMRGTTIRMEHSAKHFATSDIESTPLPAEWKTSFVAPTNLEVMQKLLGDISDIEASVIGQGLAKLNSRDLDAVFKSLYIKRDYGDAGKAIIESRLTNGRFTPEEIKYFLIDNEVQKKINPRQSRIISTPDELVALARGLPELEYSTRLDEMTRVIFDRERGGSSTICFLDYLSTNMFIDNGRPSEGGVPVTEEALLQSLKAANEVHVDPRRKLDLERIITQNVFNYLWARYVSGERHASGGIDSQAMAAFIDRVKTEGIPLNRDEFIRKASIISNKDISQQFRDLLPPEEFNFDERMNSLFTHLREHANISPNSNQHIFNSFLSDFKTFFIERNIGDEQREIYINKFVDRLSSYEEQSIAELVRFKIIHERPATEADEMAILLRKKYLQMFSARVLYKQETEQFYHTLDRIMAEDDLSQHDLNWEELLVLNSALTVSLSDFSSLDERPLHIRNFARFVELPYMREFRRRKEAEKAPRTMIQLYDYTSRIAKLYKKELDNGGLKQGTDIFSGRAVELVAYDDIRKAFLEILNNGVAEEEQKAFYNFIEEFLPKSSTTRRIKNQVAMEIFTGTTTLEEKIRFLRNNFDNLGLEGLNLVADQITTMDEYLMLREEMEDEIQAYLNPNGRTDIAAGVDNLSSKLTQEFEALLETASSDPDLQRNSSTAAAVKWLDAIRYLQYSKITFDSSSQRFNMDDRGYEIVRSFNDIVEELRDLSPTKRTSLVMKSLLDVQGGLTTQENREKLGELTVQGLQVEDPFISTMLTSAINVADASVVGYPLGELFSPLVFKGLSSENVDIEELKEDLRYRSNHQFTSEELARILRIPTHELFSFDYEFIEDPQSYPARLALESSDTYFAIYNKLDSMFSEDTQAVETVNSDIDPGIEAIIRGIQASGAVGVRSLQMARQIKDFSPAISERLAQTFDSNPGLSKLLFWENLYNFEQKKNSGDSRYLEAGTFVTDQLVSVGEKLGGGSLYTTYEAEVRDESGEVQNGVVKMLNPNSAQSIGLFYKVAFDALERVKETGDAATIRQAQQSLMMVELAQQWCLADINDPRFEADDDIFREVVSQFNEQAGSELLTIPERLHTSYYIKSETRAKGTTLNRMTQGEQEPTVEVQSAVQIALDLFSYEISHPITREAGTQEFMLRSDPHTGNIIVDTENESPQDAIIDRNLFLHLNPTEAMAVRDLWEGRPEDFFRGFINSVFESNHVGLVRRPVVGLQLKRLVEGEIARAGGLEYVDPLHLMQEVNGKFEEKGLQVPLRMHLAVKNVFALQELRRRTFGGEQDTPEDTSFDTQVGQRAQTSRGKAMHTARRFLRRKERNNS